MNNDTAKRRLLKQYDRLYKTVLIPEGEKKWSRRTIVIRLKYKSPNDDKYFYCIEPWMNPKYDGMVVATVPKRAERYILNYKPDLLKYWKGAGPDVGNKFYFFFKTEYLPLLEDALKICKRRKVSAEHIRKLLEGRDRYNSSNQ